MEYIIKTIKSKKDIVNCPVFHVDQYNWGGDYRPKTYGSLGIIPDKGFYVKMFCEEHNPPASYKNPNEPVHLDSAMEAFFELFPDTHPGCYLNFEANSFGTLHAAYGYGRYERKTFPVEIHEACECIGLRHKDYWTLELLVPFSLIQLVYGKSTFQKGDTLTCNFYKLKESEGLTHFGSYTKINHECPNFHLTEFFAKAVIN